MNWIIVLTCHVGSGSIDPDELRTVLKSCLRESAISLPEEKLDDLTLALFESADKDNSGSITFEELKAELETFPEVMENLTIRWDKTILQKRWYSDQQHNCCTIFVYYSYLPVTLIIFPLATKIVAYQMKWTVVYVWATQ